MNRSTRRPVRAGAGTARDYPGDGAMTTRLTVALCAALAFAGPTFAQPPGGPVPVPPPAPLDGPVAPLASCCTDGACDNRGPACWASADYVLAWMRGVNVPTLATASPVGTSQATAGVLGQPTTVGLFGGVLNSQARSGFRVAAGGWLDPDQTLGVEA